MTEWEWKSWAAHRRTFEAAYVEFKSEHVVFFGNDAELLLAVKNSDCNDLHPVAEGAPEWWS